MTDEQAVQDGVEETPVESTAEVQTEEIIEDQLPEEPLDHGERSQMGRKLAEEIKRREALEAKIQSLEQSITSHPVQQPYNDPYPQQQASPQRDPDEPITWGDIDRYQKEQVQKQQMYQSTYSNAVAQFGTDLSEQDYNDVVKLMVTPQIQNAAGRTGNPGIDAKLHFNEARLAFEKKRVAKLSEPQIRAQEAPPRNLGGASSTTTNMKQAAPKLSPEEKLDPYVAYLRNEGKSDEEIAVMMQAMKTGV